MNYDLVERPIKRVEIDETLIKSGDYFAVLRLDGLDPMIMYGMGSHAGHTTMALWFEEDGKRELYVVESQDAWYWPVKRIQRNKYQTWLKMAENCDFMVTLMTLSPENREKFNEIAAIERFYELEGLPYGFHAFMFGWLDTVNLNLPYELPDEFTPIVMSLLEKIDKNSTF